MLLALAAPGSARAASRPQYAKFTGQIISVSRTAIIVKGIGNYGVHTFTYSTKLSAQMSKTLNARKPKHGFHGGQEVEIVYEAGTQVAAKISIARSSRPERTAEIELKVKKSPEQ